MVDEFLLDGEVACINGNFTQCAFGSWVNIGCAPGLQCFAIPLEGSNGTVSNLSFFFWIYGKVEYEADAPFEIDCYL
jgi:hypothetical protein